MKQKEMLFAYRKKLMQTEMCAATYEYDSEIKNMFDCKKILD